MSNSGVTKEDADDKIEFRWGRKRGVGANKGTRFYESFVYDGVEYFLYDSVFLFKKGEPDPYFGKLVKIWEQPVNKKRIKVLWFFRPCEIMNHLGDLAVCCGENELFLAAGEGTGLFNVNPLEALGGKCNVVCTSRDERNPQPSSEELKDADFVFYRTFNVVTFSISEKIEDVITGIEVKNLFNRNGQKLITVTETKNVVKDEDIQISEGPNLLSN